MRFFKSVDLDKYKIYIHYKINKPLKYFENYKLNNCIETKYADVTLIHAHNLLFKKAYEEGCDKIISLSQSCVPFKSFDYVYNFLTKDHYGHFNIMPQSQCFPRCNSLLTHYDIKFIQKSYNWFILNRKICESVISYDKQQIDNEYSSVFAAEEHYFITNIFYNNLQDEIITTPNTWYSTVAGIMHLRLVPKFVDIGIDQNMNIDLIEKNISNKTKAILVVHLNGKMLDVKKIKKICDKYNIRFIEDSAQCFGGSYDNIQPGQLSDVACFSTHPTKTFFSHRDGGFLVTNNKYIYEKINKFRNHGTSENERDVCDDWGVNSRFDNLQATILIKKLKDIDHLIKKRQKNANFYLNNLDPKLYILPSNNYKIKHTFQFFVLHTYNPHKIINYMLKKKIELRRYFHIPMYKQNFFKKNYGKHKALINSEAFQATSLNLPIHHNLSRRNLIKICNYLNRIK
jgi:dTDP-4-amino-4,6-dideoxygalactose transaminase